MTTETANARPMHRIFAVTTTGHKKFRQPPTNADRAFWAEEALKAFMVQTGCDSADSLADMLADLMHWADQSGQSFDEELYRARNHYAAEVAEGGDPC